MPALFTTAHKARNNGRKKKNKHKNVQHVYIKCNHNKKIAIANLGVVIPSRHTSLTRGNEDACISKNL